MPSTILYGTRVSLMIDFGAVLLDLREQEQVALMLITHDLGVMEHFGTRVAVMYLGRVCELAPTKNRFATPRHLYTQALLSAIPRLEDARPNHIRLQGEVPTPVNLPAGCVFHGRCRQETPELIVTEDLNTLGTPLEGQYDR